MGSCFGPVFFLFVKSKTHHHHQPWAALGTFIGRELQLAAGFGNHTQHFTRSLKKQKKKREVVEYERLTEKKREMPKNLLFFIFIPVLVKQMLFF